MSLRCMSPFQGGLAAQRHALCSLWGYTDAFFLRRTKLATSTATSSLAADGSNACTTPTSIPWSTSLMQHTSVSIKVPKATKKKSLKHLGPKRKCIQWRIRTMRNKCPSKWCLEVLMKHQNIQVANNRKMEMNSMVFDIRFKPSWVDEVCKNLLINKICERTCYQDTC